MAYEYTPEEQAALAASWGRDWAAEAAASNAALGFGLRAVGFNPVTQRYYDPTGYTQGTYDPSAGQYYDLAGRQTTAQEIVNASRDLALSKIPAQSIGAASPLAVSSSPVQQAAGQVAQASAPYTPQFIQPYQRQTGPGAYGEADVFGPNKRMF